MLSSTPLFVMVASVFVAQPAKYELVEPPRKIWDQGKHNAFTDLVRVKDAWYCVFREGDDHAKGAGKIRVLRSTDGKAWASVALIEQDGVDLRDPHISVTPKGQLMIVGGAAVPPTRDPLRDHYSFVSFSSDGRDWSKPEKTLESWQWLWRVRWHGDKVYGVAYRSDSKPPRKYEGFLYQGTDGKKYERIASFDVPNTTEASLAFDGETMLCLQRRDGKPNTAMLGISKAPYKDWLWKDLGVYFGGPHLLQTPDGTWLAAGRMTTTGKPQTVLCELDVKEGKLLPLLTLPSGGDTSYVGMVWHDDQLWMSYYSSHEGKTSIYLARIRKATR
jgi:hypothetical protein